MEDAEDFEEEFYKTSGMKTKSTSRNKNHLSTTTQRQRLWSGRPNASMPKFRRQEWFRYFRLARTGWRKPNGYQSKQRLNMKYRTPMVRIGHRKIASVRGLHPSGFEEVLVKTPSDLEGSILTHRLSGLVRASAIERGPLSTTELTN